MSFRYIHQIARELPQNTKIVLKTENTFETPYCHCATLINLKDKFPSKIFIQVDKSKLNQKQFTNSKHHDIILNTTPKSFIAKDNKFVTYYDYEIVPL